MITTNSVIFWVSFIYVRYVLKQILLISSLPTSHWDNSLMNFSSCFLTDILWRQFRFTNDCVDPSLSIIYYVHNKKLYSLDLYVSLLLSIIVAVLVYFICDAVFPITFSSSSRSHGMIFCFCLEFLMGSIQCMQKVLCVTAHMNIQPLVKNVTTSPSTNTLSSLYIDKFLLDILASFTVASLSMLGSYFCHDGPIFHLSYTTMASLAARDMKMFLVLSAANILCAYSVAQYTIKHSYEIYP
jgi:hypothetical protein